MWFDYLFGAAVLASAAYNLTHAMRPAPLPAPETPMQIPPDPRPQAPRPTPPGERIGYAVTILIASGLAVLAVYGTFFGIVTLAAMIVREVFRG